jgi:hypothetical protein
MLVSLHGDIETLSFAHPMRAGSSAQVMKMKIEMPKDAAGVETAAS